MVNFFQNLFTPITSVLGAILMFFHGLGLPWWIAIALLTIVVRGVLFPLTVKQVKSMRQMQELKPRLDELREKHKDDRQKLQEEQMKLYQESGVNPVGGCLPLVIQMPIFIGLFYTIRQFGGTTGMIGIPDAQGTIPSFATGGALWFTNLSQPDPLFLLPIISAVTMVASMEMTNNSMEPQMRWVMRVVPVAFVFFTIHFPAGLVIYIVTSNFVTLLQNYLIYHHGPGRQSPGGESNDHTASEASSDESRSRGTSGTEPAAKNAAAKTENGPANGKPPDGKNQSGRSPQGAHQTSRPSGNKRRKKKKRKN